MTNGCSEAGTQFQLQYSRHLVDLRTHCGPRLALASWIEDPPRNALLLSLCLQSWICMWRWKEGGRPQLVYHHCTSTSSPISFHWLSSQQQSYSASQLPHDGNLLIRDTLSVIYLCNSFWTLQSELKQWHERGLYDRAWVGGQIYAWTIMAINHYNTIGW